MSSDICAAQAVRKTACSKDKVETKFQHRTDSAHSTQTPHRRIPLSCQVIRFIPSHPDLPHPLHLTSGLFYCQLIRRDYYSEVRDLSTERNIQYMTVHTKNNLPKFGLCVRLSVWCVYLLCKQLSHGEGIPEDARCG